MYVRSQGYGENESVPWIPEGIIGLALMFGPGLMLFMLAAQLYEEVLSKKITWAAYWSTMFGIAVAALALAGITSFDEILKALD